MGHPKPATCCCAVQHNPAQHQHSLSLRCSLHFQYQLHVGRSIGEFVAGPGQHGAASRLGYGCVAGFAKHYRHSNHDFSWYDVCPQRVSAGVDYTATVNTVHETLLSKAVGGYVRPDVQVHGCIFMIPCCKSSGLKWWRPTNSKLFYASTARCTSGRCRVARYE